MSSSKKPQIPVYRPTLGKEEWQNVRMCLTSSWISSKGKYIKDFENNFARITRKRFAISVSNGTTALHAALLSLGIGPGDEVIVPTLTYIAPVNAIRYTGANPIFVDSCIDTWQMDPQLVARAVTKRTKAILAVHLYGHPCSLTPLRHTCRKFSIPLVEDCAEAIGTTYFGKPVGCGSSLATYSFFGNKTITTGEGGMITTDDPSLAKIILSIKGQGLAPDREYWHDRIGYNYRMTNVCAAIGLAQLKKLPLFLRAKERLAFFYREKLSRLPLTFQKLEEGGVSSNWMISFLVHNPKLRDPLRKWLSEGGVETRPIFNPVHKMPMYIQKNAESYPVASGIASCGINLPSHPSLRTRDMRYIVNLICKFF